MAMWLAVPETEDGTWFDDPIPTDTKEQAVKLATTTWSGRLPASVEVVIYQCIGEEVLELPKAPLVTAEDVRGILKPAV
jgi:hypothetical protein